MYTGCWWCDMLERGHLEDLLINERTILKRILKKWNGGMNWIDLAQGRDRWRARVHAERNLSVI
jgi:hypothetical protein